MRLVLFIVVAAASATVVHTFIPFQKWIKKRQKYRQSCSLFRQCRSGLSCQPFVHKCYHKPRRFEEPCILGYSCGGGLSCQPGIHKCYHSPRRENEPCMAGYGCAPGLLCSHCGIGFGVARCQMSRVPAFNNEDYEKYYNKVAFLVTHNSFSYVIPVSIFPARNQKHSITRQLKDGVRGFMLDIYPGTGNVAVRQCHRKCIFGSLALLRTLTDIRQFLDNNPKDVVTIIFEDHLKNALALAKVFNESKISHHVLNYKHWGNATKNWPTLREMVSLGRLVVFSSYATNEFPYSPYIMWEYVKENRYGSPGKNTNNCEARSESKIPQETGLVLVNWFHTLPLPYPCYNNEKNMKKKLTTCRRNFGKWANFVAVDYYSGYGDESSGAFEVVKWLNQRL